MILPPDAMRNLGRIERAMHRAFKISARGKAISPEAEDSMKKAAGRIAARAERLGWLSALKEER